MIHSNREKSGHSFIDENHALLINRLDLLTSSLRDRWDRRAFIKSTSDFIRSLEEHFLHEETAIRGAGYAEVESHVAKHRKLTHQLQLQALEIHSYDTALAFAVLARSEILNHELVHDQEYWRVFEDELNPDDQLIEWTANLETGDDDIDMHHKALINYLNRLHNLFDEPISRKRACSELHALHAYSKMHFDEEETYNKISMSPAHIIHHETLLDDLSKLIKEIEAEEYNLEGITVHLKYWFVNHLRNFDIPTFKKTS